MTERPVPRRSRSPLTRQEHDHRAQADRSSLQSVPNGAPTAPVFSAHATPNWKSPASSLGPAGSTKTPASGTSVRLWPGRVDAPHGGEDDAAVRSNADVWSDDHEATVEAERRRLTRWALSWTWALLLVVAVTLTALVIWYALFSIGGIGD